jgi:integrase
VFLDIVEGLGWRVSAICELQAADVDLTVTEARPYGRIRKRAETDKKMGVAPWVPLSASLRAAILTVLERNPVIGEAPLFPAPRRPGKSWTRHHAKDLLERAETEAGLEPLEGSDFHACHRAWATARKHLPLKDVAEEGGWRSTETLLRCYTQADEVTMLAVVNETRKMRAARAQP